MNLTECIQEGGYIEQWGSGIARIKSACEAQGLTEPRIREKGDFVDVEFYRPKPDSAEKVPDTGEEMPGRPGFTQIVPDSVASRARTILAFIDLHGHITAPEIATLLAVKERRARAVLKDITDRGLLAKRGSARQTVYVKAGL
jgi:ATP-dependent DNA helicase RecG